MIINVRIIRTVCHFNEAVRPLQILDSPFEKDLDEVALPVEPFKRGQSLPLFRRRRIFLHLERDQASDRFVVVAFR